MYTFKHNEDGIEECYYDSSNVFYSKLIDTPNELKTLTVVFKNGGTYVYNNVDVREYVRFRDSESTGKAFQAIIATKSPDGAPKYPYHRIEDSSIAELLMRKQDLEFAAAQNKEETQDINETVEDNCLAIGDDRIELTISGHHTKITFQKPDMAPVMELLHALKISYRTAYV